MGLVVSSTVTEKVPLADSPALSVTVQLTVVVPMAKTPAAGVQTAAIWPCSRSSPIGAKLTVAPFAPVASATMLAGAVKVGALLVTSTTKVAVPVLWFASVAVQVTVVEPIGNVLPEAGTQVAVTLPSTRSAAVASTYVTTAPEALVALTAAGAVTVSTGGVVSRMSTVNVAVVVAIAASVPEQVTVVVVIANTEPDGGAQVAVSVPSSASSANTE